MRIAEINRTTAETDIKLKLNLDGTGVSNIDTGVGFLNHMLTLFARHGRFDLDVYCKGDLDVDCHHTTEDIGIALAACINYYQFHLLSGKWINFLIAFLYIIVGLLLSCRRLCRCSFRHRCVTFICGSEYFLSLCIFNVARNGRVV